MRHLSCKILPSLFTLLALLSIGCDESVENEGYCLSDEECAQDRTCNTVTRRCTDNPGTPLRTDAALDRVLDMEIDAEIDAMSIDMVIVDAMPIDGASVDAMLIDVALVDASATDGALEDAALPDAQSLPIDALIDAVDQSMPLDGSMGDAADVAIDASAPESEIDADTAGR